MITHVSKAADPRKFIIGGLFPRFQILGSEWSQSICSATTSLFDPENGRMLSGQLGILSRA
jgi:hypothetical protein